MRFVKFKVLHVDLSFKMGFQVIYYFLHLCILNSNPAVEGLLRPTEIMRGEYKAEDVNLEFYDDNVSSASGYVSTTNLKYLGCYDTWRNRFPGYLTTMFFKDMSLAMCQRLCIESNGYIPRGNTIYMLRGLFCGCIPWSPDSLVVRLEEKYCNMNCTASTSGEERSCGGNYGVSLYCNPDGTEGIKCQNLTKLPEIHADVNFGDELSNDDDSGSEESDERSRSCEPLHFRKPILPCFNCTNQFKCWTSSFSSTLTYMPQNSAEVCVCFCGKKLEFFNIKTKMMEFRNPKKYANVGWANRGPVVVPTCGCFDELPDYENITPNFCNRPCPLQMQMNNKEQMCGGDPPFVFTMYRTKSDENNPTTTLKNTIVTEEHPITTEKSDTTLATTKTAMTTTILTSISTTIEPEQETSISPYTTPDPSTSTTATSESTENPPTTITPSDVDLPNELTCPLKCREIDKHGRSWIACIDTMANQACPKNAKGITTWFCSVSGKFEGSPDYSNCSTTWIEEIHIEIGEGDVVPTLAKQVFQKLKSKVVDAKDITKPETNYFGHEIKDILGIVTQVFHKLEKNATLMSFENLTESAIGISENVLIYADPWSELPIENRTNVGTDLIRLIERSAFELTLRATQNSNSTEKYEYRKKFKTHDPEIRISAGGQSKSFTGNDTICFPFEDEPTDGSHIILPDGWANSIPDGEDQLNFVGMAIGSDFIKAIFPETLIGSGVGLSETPPDGSKFINGKLMTFTLANFNNASENGDSINFPGEGVKIRFKHDLEASLSETKILKRRLHPGEIPKAVYGSAKCFYWDTTNLEWSSSGCILIRTGRISTLCECSHLTSFTILMDLHNYAGKDFALEILTLILCPLSIACLFITIVIFTMIRSTHGTRTTITKNLCISLLLGNMLVLLVVDRHYLYTDESFCAAIGIFVHYVFLTAFMWMGIQGYHLYKQMVHVFESETSYMTIYRVVAFGVPILIVGVTGVVAYLKDVRAYGGEMYCWLQGDFVWSFLGPVAVICLGNTFVLIITLRAAHQVRRPTHIPQVESRVRSSKTWIKGGLSITVLLGLTWLTGFFMMTDSISSTISAYLFTLLNASQGIFLFLFHCLLNEKVRTALVQKNIWSFWFTFTSTGGGSSLASYRSRQSRSRENMKVHFNEVNLTIGGSEKRPGEPTSDLNCNKNQDFQPELEIKKRRPRLQIHPPLGIASSLNSFNITSSSPIKSSTNENENENENAGSKINLLLNPNVQFKSERKEFM